MQQPTRCSLCSRGRGAWLIRPPAVCTRVLPCVRALHLLQRATAAVPAPAGAAARDDPGRPLPQVVVARCRNFLGLRLSGVLMLTMLQVHLVGAGVRFWAAASAVAVPHARYAMSGSRRCVANSARGCWLAGGRRAPAPPLALPPWGSSAAAAAHACAATLACAPSRAPRLPQVGVLLAQDAAPGPGGGGELFDGERIARVSLHGLQLVMLLMLLVSEVRPGGGGGGGAPQRSAGGRAAAMGCGEANLL